VGRHEILQNIQSFTEIRLNRQFNGTSRCISHQPAHAGKLLDLLVGTTGAGVSHHKDIVVLIQPCEKHVCQLLICLIPGLSSSVIRPRLKFWEILSTVACASFNISGFWAGTVISEMETVIAALVEYL